MPEKTLQKASNHMDRKRCGAQLRKRPGQYCRKPGMENGRCKLHGGATPRGIASANFKDGRYSKHLPGRLTAEEMPERMRRRFQQMDTNGDGALDEDEMRAAAARMRNRGRPPGRP